MTNLIDKESILVAFSGGRTSAFMSWWLKENLSSLYNFHFIFANTGQEHEKTLEFVDKVDKHFGLNLVWVEAKVSMVDGEGTTYSVVDFETANRDGGVFELVIKKYGLPNMKYPHCTRELKNIPMKKWADDNIGQHRVALGIRYDEFHRVKPNPYAIYPLATIAKTSKKEVLDFWADQPFDLDIEEHQGNCLWCYKKSDRKLSRLGKENPEWFDFPALMEARYSLVKTKKESGGTRNIFRHNRTVYDVLNDLKLPVSTKKDECAEECGSILSEYESEPACNSLF